MNESKILTCEQLGDNLCKYCEITEYGLLSVNTNQFNLCEGVLCDDAYCNYLEEVDIESK